MKKNLFLAVFCLLARASPVSAANYFSLRTGTTTPINDTLRISPNFVGTDCPMYVTANFDGYLDHWFIQFTYPKEMRLRDQVSRPDMTLPYTRINGTDAVYSAILTTDELNVEINSTTCRSSFSSTSTVFGYWDPDGDGYYDQYGTVKWGPGFHNDMFFFKLNIDNEFPEGDIGISGTLTSTTDWRGVATINGTFNKTIHYIVSFLRGDANGDDLVNASDVATIIDWLTGGTEGVNPFKVAAGDMDGNGVITLNDLLLLSDYLLLPDMHNELPINLNPASI